MKYFLLRFCIYIRRQKLTIIHLFHCASKTIFDLSNITLIHNINKRGL